MSALDVFKEDFRELLFEYVKYEQALYDDLSRQKAPQPVAPNFSFARFYNWINDLEQP